MSRRRQPNVEGGRTRRREVWTTPEQDVVLQQAAERDGVTVARFLAEAGIAVARAEDAAGMVETPTQRRAQLAKLFELQGEVGELAWQVKKGMTNVNQIARGVHIGQPVPLEEMRQFLADGNRHLHEARVIYDRIGGLIEGVAAQDVDA